MTGRNCLRRVIMGGICFAVILALAGCGEKARQNPAASAIPTKRSTMETITIYSINSDTMSLIPLSVKKVSENNSLDYICSLVLQNLDEDDIEVTECIQEGNKVIISFSSAGKPVRDCSDKMEDLILESFSNSFLDNVDGCEKIIFRCDGTAYKSKQYSFGMNEVYASE